MRAIGRLTLAIGVAAVSLVLAGCSSSARPAAVPESHAVGVAVHSCALDRLPTYTSVPAGATVSFQVLDDRMSVKLELPGAVGEATIPPWVNVMVRAGDEQDIPAQNASGDLRVDDGVVRATYRAQPHIGPPGDQVHTLRRLSWVQDRLFVEVLALDVSRNDLEDVIARLRLAPAAEFADFSEPWVESPLCP